MNVITTAQDTGNLFFQRELPVRPVPDTTENFQSIEFRKPDPVPSFFKAHSLKPVRREPVPVANNHTEWMSWVLIVCFVLLAWLNVYHHKRFRQVLASTFSKRFMSQLIREGDIFSERIIIVLSMVYLIVIPMIIYECYIYFLEGSINLYLSDFRLYLAIMAGVALFWFLKIMAIRFLGTVFKTPQTTYSYLLNIFITGFMSALFLLPVTVFIIFLKIEILLYVALALAGIFFIIRFFKGFLIGISLTRFSYFYLFVYLCTLEILPWIIIAKLISGFPI